MFCLFALDYLWFCLSFLYIFDTNSLPDIWFTEFFPFHRLSLHFTDLFFFFTVQKIFSFLYSHLFSFDFNILSLSLIFTILITVRLNIVLFGLILFETLLSGCGCLFPFPGWASFQLLCLQIQSLPLSLYLFLLGPLYCGC